MLLAGADGRATGLDEIISHLKELGLNTYESKVYLSLLKNHPATGYEVSKESGVPQARAYDTLKALENRGIVISTAGKPVTYLPIAPDELLNRWEKSYQNSVDYLRDALPSMNQESVEPILNIHGEAACFRQMEELIANAQRVIFIEIWKDDAHRLTPALEAAAKRGVHINVVGYDGADFDFCHVWQHEMDHHTDKLFGGRWLVMTVDDVEGVICNTPHSSGTAADKMPKLVYTKNPGVVFVIKELVTHNIFLMDVETQLHDEIAHVYGHNLIKLRRKILGTEVG